jgi:LysM repeat protein
VRNLFTVVLWAALAVHAATPPRTVDLDKPGALEELKKNKPDHYAKVAQSMDKVQAVPYSSKGQHDLRLDVQKPDPTRRQVETSNPAKTRMTIQVGDVEYRITVLYIINPATLAPAK